jgi:folate-dependent phosphoribosylglycinamide formyltransferase PurN
MKAVILTGNQGNQKALCHKIARVCDVSAIVISENVPRRKPPLTKKIRAFVNRVTNRLAGREFVETWLKMLSEYDAAFPEFPDVPIIRVKNVNDAATIETLEKYEPGLTIVSGTNLVGKKVIGASAKIVNLHTGISPYVKGGPNCTNWCLAKNWFHLIGNTVMWLDLGIDTGKIIATEQTPLAGDETLFELHRKVMEHAHDLYVRAVRQIGEGREVPAIPQGAIAEGTTFYTADWNAPAQRAALRNFRDDYKNYFADAERFGKDSAELKLVSLV